jgi:hypothetical protein
VSIEVCSGDASNFQLLMCDEGRYPNTAVYQYKSTLDEYCDSDRNGKHHCKYVLHVLCNVKDCTTVTTLLQASRTRYLYAAELQLAYVHDLIAVAMNC